MVDIFFLNSMSAFDVCTLIKSSLTCVLFPLSDTKVINSGTFLSDMLSFSKALRRLFKKSAKNNKL